MPPRPSSVPNNTTGPILTHPGQHHLEVSSHELESELNREMKNSMENQTPPRRDERLLKNGNYHSQFSQSASGFRDNTSLKTRSEIYQQFEEQNKLMAMGIQEDNECRNNENNNRQIDQNLHFAKRLTWNLSVDDKMQTSTDGIETPIVDQNNINLTLNTPPTSLGTQNSSQITNFPGKFRLNMFLLHLFYLIGTSIPIIILLLCCLFNRCYY